MKPIRLLSLLILALSSAAAPGAAQQGTELVLGISAGAGAVHRRPGRDSWSFGPILGTRVSWGNRRSVLSLAADLQPFRTRGSTIAGDYRALYILPSLGTGSGRRQLRLGLGLGLFRFEDGVTEDGTDVGFVAGASGSLRLPTSLFLELGWRRTGNVRGLSSNVLMLQLVRLWRF